MCYNNVKNPKVFIMGSIMNHKRPTMTAQKFCKKAPIHLTNYKIKNRRSMGIEIMS